MDTLGQLRNTVLLTLSAFWVFVEVVQAEICEAGHTCVGIERCCGDMCCIPTDYHGTYRFRQWNVWNMWYFWFVVIFVLMSCFGGCGYWRRRRLLLSQQGHDFTTVHLGGPPTSFGLYGNTRSSMATGAPTAGSHYPSSITIPIYVSRGRDGAVSFRSTATAAATAAAMATEHPQGNFPQPPAYNEVISKPEEFPLRDKDDLPPYPGSDSHMEPDNYRMVLDGATTTQSTDQEPSLPPYTPAESGTTQPGVMTSGSNSSPPPSYQA